MLFKSSDASLFSMKLFAWVFICVVAIVATQVVRTAYVVDEENVALGWARFILVSQQVRPFLYGLLGALMYLLRSAHSNIADRTFDLKRTSEYYNRMLLGFVGGGVVLAFVDPKTAGFGADAIALAVGYNTDTLFDFVERLGNTVFAKTKDGGSAGDSKPGVAKLVISPPKIAPGGQGTASVTLTAAAPTGGVLVSILSDSSAVPPDKVTVLAGAVSAQLTFTVKAEAPVNTKVTITATANGSTASGTFTT
jgi:hypothetical protein